MIKCKKLVLLWLLVYSCFIQAQFTEIPDPIFESFLIVRGIDDVMDGQVLTSNVVNINFLQINETTPFFPIEDLTGIEDFQSLETLIIGFTNLVTIDFEELPNLRSISLNQDNPLITTIDVTGVPNLEILRGSNTNLSSLDVSQNPNLEVLTASNTNLSTLDVSLNPLITQLTTFNNENLQELDVRSGANENITFFGATGSPNLTCIFVDDAAFSTANWTDIDPTTTFVETNEECEALSLEDFQEHSIKLFPNPASTTFQIDSTLPVQEVTIYNLNGQLAARFTGTQQEYPIHNLKTGLYLLNIQTTSGSINRKLVVR